MRIKDYKVKPRFKPARIISDVLSLALCGYSALNAVTYTERFPELNNSFFRADLIRLWAFPCAMLAVIAVYLILTFTSHRFEKYNITAENAQSVYDWYAFSVSLCKLPIMIMIIELMSVFQARLAGSSVSWISPTYILYVLMVAIIIRFAVHRIRTITKPADSAKDSGRVKIKVRTLDDENNKKGN